MLPLILVTNDDGIQAPGVRALIDAIHDLGEIVCLCPDSPRSGGSMALTVKDPLRLTEHAPYRGARMLSCSGTPTDCVKLAWHAVLAGRRPALVASGINHGSNAAINVLYSGTMGAAQEGCAQGVPSVGFSLTDHAHDADFTGCLPFVRDICAGALQHGLPRGICLNVNVPDVPARPSRMSLVRQAEANWSDEYKQYADPFGHPFYMLAGDMEDDASGAADTDLAALARGEVAVTPVTLDRTPAVASLRPTAYPPDCLAWLEELCRKSYAQ